MIMEAKIIVEGVGKIAEKIKELVVIKKEKREKRFEKIFQPLYTDFLKIHADYIGLFENVNRALIDALGSNDPVRVQQIVTRIREDFSAQRLNYDGIRTGLRAQAQEILSSTKSKLELRFVWSLLCYFLDWGAPFQSDEEIDAETAKILKDGASAWKNTPSSVIMNLLSGDSDCKKMQRNVQIRMENCSKDLSGICKAFARLQDEAYK